MALITLRVLDGADRGHTFADLPTPVTIGREDGNKVKLNDERISRFHIKIQEDQDKLVLTDLESTNGTRVNGEEVQLRILRYGDVVSLGQSVLLYGTREQIAMRLANLRSASGSGESTVGAEEFADGVDEASLEFELNWSDDPDDENPLHVLGEPSLPMGLGPCQAAELSELLEYLHVRIRHLIDSVRIKGSAERISLETREWQNLLDLQSRLAEFLRAIGDPDDDGITIEE